MILITGFGPFLDVKENPSGALARRAHGERVAGETLVGLELPVAYDRGIDRALRMARASECRAVIGLGVATGRGRVEVERLARNLTGLAPDVDGQAPGILEPGGPEIVAATLNPELLAAACGASVSDDAGVYVCNAWLYRMLRGLTIPVGFIHIPSEGVPLERLLDGIRGWLARA